MKNVFGTLILILSGVNFAFGECSAADKQALEAFDKAWATTNQSGDRNAMARIYADDFVGFPGMQTKASALDGAMANFERNKTNPSNEKVTPDHYRISCTPTSATIVHRNVIWTPDGPGGKPATFYSRSVHFLEKRGGAWQVVSNAGNDLDDASVIWYLEQDWNDAVLKRDKAWFEKNYAADFTGVSSLSGRLSNKAADIADTINDKSTMELVETTNVNVRVEGNAAIATGIFRLKGKDEKGAAFDRRIRYTDVFIKRDGRWQAWSSHGTDIK